MTTLIISEKHRIAEAVAGALKATRKLHYGVFTNGEITVAYVRKDFITLTSLADMADDKLPFVPSKYKMRVTDKVTDRRLKRLVRKAKEIVFASPEGADAQARFFNLCRHFRVGQPTSRMWLTRLDRKAIKVIFAKREKGRILHDLAQTGLVAQGMEQLFQYNFSRVLDRWYYNDKSLSRQEASAMGYLGLLSMIRESIISGKPEYRIVLNGGKFPLTSEKGWEKEADCAHILAAVKPGDTIEATMTVKEVSNPSLSPYTMLSLQMDAFENFGFMPSKTINVATRLFEKGIITSPFTNNPKWGIETLRNLPLRISRAERKLYTLIAGRMEAVKATPATYQVANYSVGIAGVRLSYDWILAQPKPEYIGTSKQQFTVNTVGVCPVSPECDIDFRFPDTLYNLYRFNNSGTYSNKQLPYFPLSHEWGTVLEGLERKGFITVNDGYIGFTSEGRRLLIDIEPYNFETELIADVFNPVSILLGHAKGRKLMVNFEEWVTDTVNDILNYVPKDGVNPEKIAPVQALPEK